MNHLESTKTVAKLGTSDTTTAQTFTSSIDTLGYDYASIDVIFGPAASTSSVSQTLTLKQGDTSSPTEDVTGFTGSLRPAAYAGQTVTTAMTISRIEVDLRGKKRYLAVNASPNTDTVIVIAARLGRGEEGPYNAATKNVAVNTAG